MADGKTIASFGTIMVMLHLGDQCLEQQIVVVNIDTQAMTSYTSMVACLTQGRELC